MQPKSYTFLISFALILVVSFQTPSMAWSQTRNSDRSQTIQKIVPKQCAKGYKAEKQEIKPIKSRPLKSLKAGSGIKRWFARIF